MIVKQLCAFWITYLCFGYFANADNGTNTMWNATWTDTLKRDLLLNYDKYARPAEYYNATNVDLSLVLRFFDVDEFKSVMTVHGWMKMFWTDDKLKWDPEAYGGLKSIHLSDHEVWQPDITLYNGASGSNIDHYGNTHLILYNTGYILWVPPAQFPVYCNLNLKLWPFDTQTCSVIMGSWTYHAYAINITVNDTEGFSRLDTVDNQEWEVLKLDSDRHIRYYDCCVEPYVNINFNLTIKRRSPMFNSVVVTPASVLILMTLANFWLPPTSGEKIILNGVNAIIIVIYLMYFAEQLPVMAMNTPLVVSFYSCSLYLVGISMVLSVLVINMSRSKHRHTAPHFVKQLLDGWPGKVLGLNYVNTQAPAAPRSEELRDTPFEEHNSADDHQMINAGSGKVSNQSDWILFATAIDRIVFILYCFIFIVLAITYSI